MVKTNKPRVPKKAAPTRRVPRGDVNGWVLCPGDHVLVVSPGEEYHGLFGRVDTFPTKLELSCYVQLDGRPSATGRVLLPNAQLRWMGPDEAQVENHRPTRPGQQVRVVLENEALATPEMKSLEGKLGTTTAFDYTGNSLSMVTVKFDDPELAPWPTAINSYDLLVVPLPVVQYVPEPVPVEQETDLPMVDDAARLADGRDGRPTPHQYLTELAPTLTADERCVVASVGYGGKDMAKFFGANHTTAVGLYRKGALVLVSATGGSANRYVVATGLPEILANLTVQDATKQLAEPVIQSGITSVSKTSPELVAKVKRAGRKQEPVAPLVHAGEVARETAPAVAPKKATTFEDFQKILATHSAGLRVLPLASITIGRNTRQVFDEAALAELAESIKASGLINPITVRPYAAEPGKYELVAGARRFRACLLAGLPDIMAVVRVLTDREFLEVQLLENLQRVDVRPADEAQAFAELLRNGYSAEEIGLKVGKGEKFVLQRAKLASLIPFWFEALQDDRLPLVAAHELARLPAHSQVAVKKAVASYYNSPAPRYGATDLRNYIHRVVLRELAQAPFPTEDATLVPAAGPCQSCPKRSGACGLLFEVADAKDTCLDATCYQGKVEAFVKRRTAELSVEGKKPLLITSDYETKDKNVLGTKLYTETRDNYQGTKRVYEAVRVDGPYAGKVVRITLDADTGKSDAEISNQKQVDAARLRKERHTKTHRVLIAEKLTADLPAALDQPDGPVFGAILDHLLLEVCSTSKDVLAYLRESWGWEPDEAALKNDYKGKDAQGFWPWQQYVRQAIRPLGWQRKLELYLAIKVRHRMNYDYEDAQFTLAKLIGGHGYPELDAQADETVEARYYTKKGKKQEAVV